MPRHPFFSSPGGIARRAPQAELRAELFLLSGGLAEAAAGAAEAARAAEARERADAGARAEAAVALASMVEGLGGAGPLALSAAAAAAAAAGAVEALTAGQRGVVAELGSACGELGALLAAVDEDGRRAARAAEARAAGESALRVALEDAEAGRRSGSRAAAAAEEELAAAVAACELAAGGAAAGVEAARIAGRGAGDRAARAMRDAVGPSPCVAFSPSFPGRVHTWEGALAAGVPPTGTQREVHPEQEAPASGKSRQRQCRPLRQCSPGRMHHHN